MNKCNLTGKELKSPIYTTHGDLSLTSLSTFREGKANVYFSESIGHLITKPPMDVHSYYDTEYTISLDSEDDDQLYKVVEGTPIYRIDHQAKTMLDKLPLSKDTKVLDYGCAKGGVMRKLESLKGIQTYLFDVSEMYIPFWKKFSSEEKWASYNIKPEWKGSFDVVTSFFVLEHVEKPIDEVLKMREALKDGGMLYFIVPNVYNNIADFILSDHVNHFSKISIRLLLEKTGFELVDIDENAHNAAFVVTARKVNETTDLVINQEELASIQQRAYGIADLWSHIRDEIRKFEANCDAKKVAIYGAGVYGNFIASCLKDRSKVEYFIDQSAFLQGKEILDIPVIKPEQLPETIDTAYIGLNPVSAKKNISSIKSWENRAMKCFYIPS